MSEGNGGPSTGLSKPPRPPSGPIRIWTAPPKQTIAPKLFHGDRFDSLPDEDKKARRARDEQITGEPAPAGNAKPGSSRPWQPGSSGISKHQAWLASELKWQTKIGTGWIGKKVLGAGAFGIAGLWSLEDTVANKDRLIKHVVVKQAGARGPDIKALREEAEILQLFKGVETKHIVRMYGGYMVEMLGSQIDPTGTQTGNHVARIFIEYCEGGDMRNFLRNLKRKFTARDPIPEELIWEIFKCLVLGIAVLENGNEDPTGATWNKPVVHLDIKPENILIGTNDNEHLKTPVIKLADFGVSRVTPNPQSIDWMKQQLRNLPSHYRAPEADQMERKYPDNSYDSDDSGFTAQPTIDPNIKLGSHTNVWGIGKVMYNLINRSRSFSRDTPIYWFLYQGIPMKPIRTQGTALLNAPYSPLLRETVMHCLAVDWKERPKTRELLKVINDRLIAIANPATPAFVKAGPGVGLGSGFDAGFSIYPEPTDPFPALGS